MAVLHISKEQETLPYHTASPRSDVFKAFGLRPPALFEHHPARKLYFKFVYRSGGPTVLRTAGVPPFNSEFSGGGHGFFR
jgi:hypothetical protein